jgi:cytochrome o ubiquinol oxidase operon protein cyoD
MNKAVVSHHQETDIRLKTYIIGFIASVALTLAAYVLVVNHSFSRVWLITAILLLAMVQFTVQLVFFLHLSAERKPRWKFLAFSFMVGVVLILVLGSIWIMNNLNYHMASHGHSEQYMHENEGL